MGILCAFGLRAPLKFLPLFTLQLVYKSFWFLFVFFPLIFQGTFPEHGWASAVGNLMWMLLDIKAIPWRYLLSRDQPLELAADAGEEPSRQSDQENELRRVA